MNITLFFVFCFLNLSDSFKLKNNTKLNTKLNMNYIDSSLHIHYKNDHNFSCIDLKKFNTNNYLLFENYYEDKNINYFPCMKLVIIYNENTFVNPFFEIKFKNLIEREIKMKNKMWNDINTIIKTEENHDKY
jgi:hypothetical protein